jgi:hypothetical protein
MVDRVTLSLIHNLKPQTIGNNFVSKLAEKPDMTELIASKTESN